MPQTLGGNDLTDGGVAFRSHPCKPVFTKYAKSCVFWEVGKCPDQHRIVPAASAATVRVQYSHC